MRTLNHAEVSATNGGWFVERGLNRAVQTATVAVAGSWALDLVGHGTGQALQDVAKNAATFGFAWGTVETLAPKMDAALNGLIHFG